jgi:hypothetical protein
MDAAARSFELASAPALLLLSPSLPICSRCCSLGSEEGVAGDLVLPCSDPVQRREREGRKKREKRGHGGGGRRKKAGVNI